MADDEISPGGSAIVRHTNSVEFQIPQRSAEHFDELEDHLSGFLGPSSMVLHEILSDQVHLDVVVFPPNPDRDFWTLVTSGMSDRPMKVGDVPDAEEMRFAEIVIGLPKNWFVADQEGVISDDQFEASDKYWPVQLIKFLARLPHLYETWLWLGHSIPNYEPATPYAQNTTMSGAILVPPINWDVNNWAFRRKDGNLVTFLAVIPVYHDEMDYKLAKGVDALAEKFDKVGVTEILDIARPSVVTRGGFFGFFRN